MKYIYEKFVTIYEKTNMIGTRTEQIARGAKSTLPENVLEKFTSPRDIAMKEYDLGVIPMKITRKMPSGEQVSVSLQDLTDKST